MESEHVTRHRSGGHLRAVDAGDAGAAGPTGSDRLDRWATMAQLEERRAALDERIGVLSAQIHALSAELVDAIADYDDAQGWQGGGFLSMSHWLSVRTKFTSSEGRRLASLVERRHDIPTLMGHARAGRMSLGVMAAAARVTTEQNEERVAEIAMACTPSQAARVLAKYRALAPTPRAGEPASDRADDGAAGTPVPEPEPSSWWRCWYDEQGRGRIDAALTGDVAALVEQAWAAATAAGEREHARHPHMGDPSDARCDRLRRLSANETAERFASTMLDHANDDGLRAPGGDRYGVVVNIDVETLARVLGLDWDPSLPIRLGSECFDSRTGRHLAHHEVARILCDANISVLVHHRGVPLWMSNETRTANRHQRRALQFRSGGKGGCEFPGCTQSRYLDAHHVTFHSADGRTDLANMVLLCGHHHRALHRGEYSLTTQGDQRFTFTDRHGGHLGCTNTAHGPGGAPPALQHLPGLDRPPDPPPEISGDTPRSTTHGERLTPYALDTYLHHLLTA